MSQQAIIKLAKLAETDEALLAELQAATTDEEKAAVGVIHGCDVRAEELATLRALVDKHAGDELSDSELELASGGALECYIKSKGTKQGGEASVGIIKTLRVLIGS
jgi:predicted ribosomally synthesized peptide with nif11-like leader